VEDNSSGAEKLAKDMGITLRQGQWKPDPSVVTKRQAEFRKSNEDQSNMQGRLGAVVIIFIMVMVAMSVVNMDAACFFPLLIVLMFGVIVSIMILLSNHIKPAPYVNWEEQYPVVKVERTQMHLNDQGIDFTDVAGAEVDRYHNEIQLINKALKRRSIPLDAYKDVTEMVLAMQGALEANGVRVFDKYPEWKGPSALQSVPEVDKSPGLRSHDEQQDISEEPWVVTPVEKEPERPPMAKDTTVKEPIVIPSTKPAVGIKGPGDQICSKCGAVFSEDLIECPNCGIST
jgi:hypothetical protein